MFFRGWKILWKSVLIDFSLQEASNQSYEGGEKSIWLNFSTTTKKSQKFFLIFENSDQINFLINENILDYEEFYICNLIKRGCMKSNKGFIWGIIARSWDLNNNGAPWSFQRDLSRPDLWLSISCQQVNKLMLQKLVTFRS